MSGYPWTLRNRLRLWFYNHVKVPWFNFRHPGYPKLGPIDDEVMEWAWEAPWEPDDYLGADSD